MRDKRWGNDKLQHTPGSINEHGFGQISKVVMQDKRLSVYAKAIYAYLCSYAGGGITAFPSVTRICGDLKLSRSTFYKHFQKVLDAGYVNKTKSLQVDNKFANNVYEIVYIVKK